jgi:hypothetical protein
LQRQIVFDDQQRGRLAALMCAGPSARRSDPRCALEQRQQHGHHRAAPGLAVDVDAAAQFTDVLRALVGADAHAAVLGAAERAEQRLRMNSSLMPCPVSPTSTRACPLRRSTFNHTLPWGRGVQCVLHKVSQHTLQPFFVAAGGQRGVDGPRACARAARHG